MSNRRLNGVRRCVPVVLQPFSQGHLVPIRRNTLIAKRLSAVALGFSTGSLKAFDKCRYRFAYRLEVCLQHKTCKTAIIGQGGRASQATTASLGRVGYFRHRYLQNPPSFLQKVLECRQVWDLQVGVRMRQCCISAFVSHLTCRQALRSCLDYSSSMQRMVQKHCALRSASL